MNDSKKTILLVEDEVIISIAEKMALEKYGYKVLTENTGEKAVDTVDNTPGIDLILMDINLGSGIEGTEAAEIILGKHDIPLIFLSSHTEREIVEKTEGITSYGYVVKSSSITVLDASIKMAFKLFYALKKEQEKEEALLLSEKNYRDIYDNALEGIFRTTPDGKVIQANRSMAVMLGYDSPEEVISSINDTGKQVWINSDDRSRFAAILKEQGRILYYETRFKRKDGSNIWVSLNSQMILDDKSKNYYFDGFIQDITERKLAEEVLFATEEQYQQLFDVCPDGIMLINTDGVIMKVNIEQKRMFRYGSPEELTGINAAELVARSSRDYATHILRRRLSGEYIPPVEYELLRKDGTTFFGETTAALLHDSTGETSGYLCVTRDITMRKKAEEEVRLSRERLTSFMDSASDSFYLLDSDLRVILINQKALELIGAKREHIIGMSMTEILPGIVQSGRYERYKEVIRTGIPFVIENFTHDNFSREMNFILKAFKVGNGIGIISTDITENKRVEQALKKSEEKFSKAFMASPSIIVLTRLSDSRMIEVNESFERLLGFTREEAIGHTTLELGIWINPSERKRLGSELNSDGKLKNIELLFRTKGGEIITCIYSSEMIEVAGEKHVLAVIENITERKQAEEKLYNSEKLYRKTFNAVDDFIHIIDSDFKLVLFNEMFSRNLKEIGITGDISGRNIFEVCAFLPEKIREEYQSVFNTGKTLSTEESIMIGSSVRWSETSKIPVRDYDGKIYQVVTIIHDVTKRKLMYEQLKETNGLFELVYNINPDAAQITRLKDGCVVHVNEGYSRISGFSKDDAIGKSTLDIDLWKNPADRQKILKELNEKGICSNYETVFKRKDGSLFTGMLSARIFSYLGELHIITVIRDVSDRKLADEELRQYREHFQDLVREGATAPEHKII